MAQEQDARAAARALAQEGAELFEKDDFHGALDKFKQAYEHFPSPKLFLNIGQALRGLSQDVAALEAFQRFLDEAKDAAPDFRDQATAQVAELSGRLARVTVDCNRPGAEVAVDSAKAGTTPLSRPIVVVPGAHRLVLSWDGETKSLNVVAEAGKEVAYSVSFEERKPLPPAAAPVPEPAPQILPPVQPQQVAVEQPKAKSHTWYWIAGGAIVAAAAVTVVILLDRQYPNPDLGTRQIGDVR